MSGFLSRPLNAECCAHARSAIVQARWKVAIRRSHAPLAAAEDVELGDGARWTAGRWLGCQPQSRRPVFLTKLLASSASIGMVVATVRLNDSTSHFSGRRTGSTTGFFQRTSQFERAVILFDANGGCAYFAISLRCQLHSDAPAI